MSSDNPFQSGAANPVDPYAQPSGTQNPVAGAVPPHPNNVPIRPFELISRSRQLVGDKYWLFLGITVIAMVISQMVPMGIVTGAMMIGIFVCLLCQEKGYAFDFATLFKGFDQFGQSFIAILMLLVVSFVLMLPAIFLMLFGILAAGRIDESLVIIVVVLLIPVISILSLLIYLPFVFVFQLMAEYQLDAIPAIKLSWEGTKRNLGGILGYLIVNFFIGIVLSLMCYIPAILFMPIFFGTMLLLYRDVYGSPQAPIQPTGSEPPPQSSVSY